MAKFQGETAGQYIFLSVLLDLGQATPYDVYRGARRLPISLPIATAYRAVHALARVGLIEPIGEPTTHTNGMPMQRYRVTDQGLTVLNSFRQSVS